MKYEFLEHTADAKFRAYGATLDEAFASAAEAMFSLLIDPSKVEKREDLSIEVRGHDEKSLLYNFLEEFLFLFDTTGFLLSHVKEIHITDNKLTAKVVGDKLGDKYKIEGHIKAVTYNEMDITRGETKVSVQVVLDL
jgi:SHS2 domain-containing protein